MTASRALAACAAPKACYRAYELTAQGDTLQFGELRLQSASLKKNLQGCRRLFLFAALLDASGRALFPLAPQIGQKRQVR